MFQALSTAYSKQVDELLDNGLGKMHMSKRFFYKMFKKAWDASFIKEYPERISEARRMACRWH
jgi:hypothetical protein